MATMLFYKMANQHVPNLTLAEISKNNQPQADMWYGRFQPQPLKFGTYKQLKTEYYNGNHETTLIIGGAASSAYN